MRLEGVGFIVQRVVSEKKLAGFRFYFMESPWGLVVKLSCTSGGIHSGQVELASPIELTTSRIDGSFDIYSLSFLQSYYRYI